ncbi:hypothetical protein K450DRAFT_248353 [Umbelopsis ramanniana AG]|uniref:Uncharacterized protein n=1 Tax=Umbelopsis ramanniana AG TaxID=1314678 RepID=A0AAD5E759_UMBRA|nr:uncharacterized protein K450DRAFT_248353 [Umbelopsis ramanniana AG]KAI8578152.1 hypothetical protein K450DRAFT_248353 [Umbelopsis ramanniana AG]
MVKLNETIKDIVNSLGILLGFLFFCAIFTLAIGLYAQGMWDLGNHIVQITHLGPTNCTILRASITSGDNGDSWAIHVNYTTPSSSSTLGESHVSFLEDADINTLYTVNSTIPCFYSTYDLDYATLSNDGAPAVDIIIMVFSFAICLPFIWLFLRAAVICLHPVLLPPLMFLQSIPKKVAQLGNFLTNSSVEISRKRKRFVPLAQSEEEAFGLESTDGLIIASPPDSLA